MLKTLNMVLVRCPVGSSEGLIAVFQMKNLKLTPKKAKVQKVSIFQCFYAFFVKFWTDFVNWIVLRGQQGKV